jgi:hypothetical protein
VAFPLAQPGNQAIGTLRRLRTITRWTQPAHGFVAAALERRTDLPPSGRYRPSTGWVPLYRVPTRSGRQAAAWRNNAIHSQVLDPTCRSGRTSGRRRLRPMRGASSATACVCSCSTTLFASIDLIARCGVSNEPLRSVMTCGFRTRDLGVYKSGIVTVMERPRGHGKADTQELVLSGK